MRVLKFMPVTDQNLRHTLQFGIGLHHAGLNDKNRSLVEELFANNKIQVLVCTSTLAWGVNLPAHLVIIKFLYEPFPVESSLKDQLHEHINAEIVSRTISNKQDAVHYLTWTYLFRRLRVNPAYYGLEESDPKSLSSFLSRYRCNEHSLDKKELNAVVGAWFNLWRD